MGGDMKWSVSVKDLNGHEMEFHEMKSNVHRILHWLKKQKTKTKNKQTNKQKKMLSKDLLSWT